MDAVRILGELIKERAASGGGSAGGAMWGQVLNGIASAQAQQNNISAARSTSEPSR